MHICPVRDLGRPSMSAGIAEDHVPDFASWELLKIICRRRTDDEARAIENHVRRKNEKCAHVYNASGQ